MYTATKNNKKLKDLYQKALEIKSAIPHPRIMGMITLHFSQYYYNYIYCFSLFFFILFYFLFVIFFLEFFLSFSTFFS